MSDEESGEGIVEVWVGAKCREDTAKTDEDNVVFLVLAVVVALVDGLSVQFFETSKESGVTDVVGDVAEVFEENLQGFPGHGIVEAARKLFDGVNGGFKGEIREIIGYNVIGYKVCSLRDVDFDQRPGSKEMIHAVQVYGSLIYLCRWKVLRGKNKRLNFSSKLQICDSTF